METLKLMTPAVPGERLIREDSPTEELISWSLERFSRQRLVLTTSFGMEGCALIDMAARHGKPIEIIYLDTHFFFPETHELRERMAERYPHLKFVNRGTSLTPEEQEALHGPELWKRDPDACCKLRKVMPMREALRDVDIWVTALRRGQSEHRAGIRVIEWDWSYGLLKISPLAGWTRAQVWDYIRANDVPYNRLHDQGYPSIGCTNCTVRVEGLGPGDYSREGRWKGTGKTECGLHGYGI